MSYAPACKFEDAQVIDIRNRFASGQSGRSIAREYNASRMAIFDMVYGRTYTNVGGPISPPTGPNPNARLNPRLARRISLERSNGAKVIDLAKKYKVSPGTISKAVNGKTWLNIDDLPPPLSLTDQGAEALIEMLRS